MLSDADRQTAAQFLRIAETACEPVTQLSSTLPDITFDDAYRVEVELASRKGDTVHGDFGPLGGVAVQFV